MMQVQLLFVIIITFFYPNTCLWTPNSSQSMKEESFYRAAFSLVCDSLLKQGSIKDKSEAVVNNNFTRFRLEEFSDEFVKETKVKGTKATNNFDSLLQMFDLLKKESDSLNKACSVRPNDTLTYFLNTTVNKSTPPKYVIFFSKLCDKKLQLDIFPFNPRLNSVDYLNDYYGPYRTLLLQFNNNGKITKNYSTEIDSN